MISAMFWTMNDMPTALISIVRRGWLLSLR